MTMLFFLGAGWLVLEYPLPALLVVTTALLLKHLPPSRKGPFSRW
jgi:hypothetical protein